MITGEIGKSGDKKKEKKKKKKEKYKKNFHFDSVGDKKKRFSHKKISFCMGHNNIHSENKSTRVSTMALKICFFPIQ